MRSALPTLVAALALAAPAAAACPDGPAFDPRVPTWRAVNGFELGARAATHGEVAGYMNALASRSPKVRGGELASRTWRGRRIPYLIVSHPRNLQRKRLAASARRLRALRRGELRPRGVRAAARTQPASVVIGASVHGDEPSGSDASMKLLYELAARTDCHNLKRLRRLLTVIVPIQNPDGRITASRGNAYRFDLNRDWFARTQPETDAAVSLLRRFPPIAVVDAHEDAGDSYSFPPNADPVHHEVPAQALGAINEAYAPELAAAAEREGFDHSSHSAYDLFFMGYADSAASTAFGAAGMTFEKGAGSPYPEKTAEHFATQDATVSVAANHKAALLERWGRSWLDAARQGKRGALEPNVAVQPGAGQPFPVPEVSVFGYFLRADRSRGDAARLARRLRALDVRVYRLTRPARLRSARRYGEPRFRTERLPRGTFWIPMAQSQKHWIQALLGEDPYAAFPYFPDVSSWSNPLLMGLQGGFVARRARPRAELWDGKSIGRLKGPGPAWRFRGDSSEELGLMVDLLRAKARVIRSRKGVIATRISKRKLRRLARRRDAVLRPFGATLPPRQSVDLRLPKVAILADSAPAGSSTGFAKYVSERRLGLDADVVSAADLDRGALEDGGFTALVVPPAFAGVPDSGRIQRFVRRGGRYIGFGRGGLALAAAAGLTLATEAPAPLDYQVPGASFRMEVDRQQALGWGFYEWEGWLFNVGDPILRAHAATGTVVADYPAGDRFFSAGYSEGADALRGSAAAISEEVGSGQSILFSFDPNFRGYTEGTIRMFANAVLHPVAGQGAKGASRPGPPRPTTPARAPAAGPDAVIRVPLADEAALRAAIAALDLPAGARVTRDLRGVSLRVPSDPAGDERAWPGQLLERLERAGVRPNLVVL